MASVRNESDPVPQTASNSLIFQMMLHYKQQLEAAQAEREILTNVLATQQSQIHQLVVDNRQLTTANQRGANLVNMKHEAGIMFGQCTDRVAELFGTMRREIPEVMAFHPEMERIILRADFAHHMLHGINFVDLTADDELTEEEEEMSDEEVEL